MTAEVAVMNRAALVFAADSATTVTYWIKGERQTRYFKGANKLFQISAKEPVGLMINGSAALQDVPWEILAKDFRRQREESFSRLDEYAGSFFDFVGQHTEIFPADLKRQAFIDAAAYAAHTLWGLSQRTAEYDAANDDAERVGARNAFNAARRDELSAMGVPPHLTEEEINGLVAEHGDDVFREIFEADGALDLAQLGGDQGGRAFAETAILESIKNYTFYQDLTGVVVGGYGREEYFPSIVVFKCYGFVGKKLCAIRDDGSSRRIGGRQLAAIEPFATTSMINTFRMGISPDVFGEVISATEKTLAELAQSITEKLDLQQAIPQLDVLLSQALESHRELWFSSARENHYGPLAKVVASLPITDMAALANSLIELQSLKERVTEPSESVSGPIDVAVITKHDGFVWIERKHYFRPELNSRFFSRQVGVRNE